MKLFLGSFLVLVICAGLSSQAVLSDLTEASRNFAQSVKNSSEKALSSIKETSEHLLSSAKGATEGLLASAKNTSESLKSAVKNTAETSAAKNLINKVESLLSSTKGAAKDTAESAAEATEASNTTLTKKRSKRGLLSSITNTLTAAKDTSESLVSAAIDTQASLAASAKNASESLISSLVDAPAALLSSAKDASESLISASSALLSPVKETAETAKNTSEAVASLVEDDVETLVTSAVEAPVTLISAAKDASESLVSDASETLSSSSDNVVSSAVNAAEASASIQDTLESLVSAVVNTSSSLLSSPKDTLESLVSSAANASESLVSSAVEAPANLLSSAKDASESLVSTMVDTSSALLSSAKATSEDLVSSAASASEALASSVQDASAAFASAVESVIPSDSLKLVHVLFRHGHRNPEQDSLWTSNPYYSESNYPEGYGQLVNKGKLREYNLGQLLRARYDSFLGEEWNIDKLDVRTTDFNRTKMSCQLMLAGLFPPKQNNVWNVLLNWQPIPYYYQPSDNDRELEPLLCPDFQDELEDAQDLPDVQTYLLERYGATMDIMSEKTGIDADDYDAAANYYFGMVTQEGLDLPLEEWTSLVYPEPLRSLTVDMYYVLTNTTRLRRLMAGGIVNKILTDSQSLAQGTLAPPDRRMFVYSAHENNVAGLLLSLDAYELTDVPDYGAVVMVEVHEVDGVYGVKLFYHDYTTLTPHGPLVMPGCAEFCPLATFAKLVGNILPGGEEICNSKA